MASLPWTTSSVNIRGGPLDGMTMNDDGSFTPTLEPTEASLRSMGFFGLRRKLLLAYIPCDGASTIDELMAIHAEKYGTDRSQLPLYNERSQKRGRMGVCACANLNINYTTGEVIGDPSNNVFVPKMAPQRTKVVNNVTVQCIVAKHAKKHIGRHMNSSALVVEIDG